MKPETEQEILELIEGRFSIKEISERLSISEKQITKVRKRHDIVGKSNGFFLSVEDQEELIKLYKTGEWSFQALAKKFHIWGANARRTIVESGNAIKLARHSKEVEDRLSDLYINSDLTVKDISDSVGVTVKVLYRVIRERNLHRTKKVLAKPRILKSFRELYIDRYGEEEGLKQYEILKERQRKNSSGKNNPMYGKPSPMGSGIGWKGWYGDFYFRSLREVAYLIEIESHGIKWETAETMKIQYFFNGKERTYRPDFIVGNQIIEIKPKRLQKSMNVLAKKEAAEKYCSEHGLEYIITDQIINGNLIKEQLELGKIKFDRDYEKRFLEFCEKN